MMKVVLISDTHEQHDKVPIPECDILIHAGDFTYRGEHLATQIALEWLDRQPAKHIVAIAGNHDWLFEKQPEAALEILSKTRIKYLENSAIEIGGLKFWGSPITPEFMNWAFNCDRADIFKYWQNIPTDTDVLITHGPPLGVLDQAAPHKNTEHLGCYDLAHFVSVISPRIHVFGHIHGGHGSQQGTTTRFFNASVVNEAYAVEYAPFELTL